MSDDSTIQKNCDAETVERCKKLVEMWRRTSMLSSLLTDHEQAIWGFAAQDLENTLNGWDCEKAAQEFRESLKRS